uniref:(northern house mosquito) hypothetical protein n=1 Tax=Culex pipiens TaxID=7175 RepID=A0A8D8H122_CULPI
MMVAAVSPNLQRRPQSGQPCFLPTSKINSVRLRARSMPWSWIGGSRSPPSSRSIVLCVHHLSWSPALFSSISTQVYQQVVTSFYRNTNTHTRKPSVWTPQMIILSSSSSNADGGLNQVKSRRSSTSLRRGHLLLRSSLTF